MRLHKDAKMELLKGVPLFAGGDLPERVGQDPMKLTAADFRLKHGEVRVSRDATLDRIALEQARAIWENATARASRATPS